MGPIAIFPQRLCRLVMLAAVPVAAVLLFAETALLCQETSTASEWLGPAVNEQEKPFYLGMKVTTTGKPAAIELGVGMVGGAVVLRVDQGSPAARAGLRPADVIVAYGPYTIETVEDLVAAVSQSTRDVPIRLIFVRNMRRWSTPFQPETRTASPPLAWYVHPDRAYRLQLPTAWRIEPLDPTVRNVTVTWDVLVSPDEMYRVHFARRSRPAPSSPAALDEFAQERRTMTPDGTVKRSKIGSIPIVWLGSYQGDSPRVAVYELAFCHAGRLYQIDLSAPVLSLLDELPMPLAHLLSTLQLSATSRVPSDTPSQAADTMTSPTEGGRGSTPASPLPADWVRVSVGDVELRVPPDLQASEFTGPGEAVWYRGSELLPELVFGVYRDRPLSELCRGGVVKGKSQVQVASQTAEQYLVEATVANRAEKGIVTMWKIKGRSVSLVGFARAEEWDELNRLHGALSQSIRIAE